MKNLITLSVALLSLIIVVNAANNNIRQVTELKRQIDSEIINYTKIEEIKNDSCSKDLFLEDGMLKLVLVTVNEGDILKTVSWYFNNDQIIYAEQWWMNEIDNIVYNSEKLYVFDNQLVAWEKTGNGWQDENSAEFKETERKIIEYSATILEGMN